MAEEKFRNIEERIAALWERLVLHNGQKLISNPRLHHVGFTQGVVTVIMN
jgi:hypothetical protein